MKLFSCARVGVCLAALLLLLSPLATFADVHTNAVPVARVTSQVDNAKRTTLFGHVPGALRTAKDQGRINPNTAAPGMIMVLRSSEEQKKEIRKVIDEQQDKRTANYHQWMTPEEFGAHFGVDDADIAKIKSWLTSQGFTVDEVSKSKRVIRFSGTTGQIEQAFQTEMHTYQLGNGETHVSNNSEITVPEVFSKVIAGVTLHNFFRKGGLDPKSMIKFGPKYTSSSSVHYVGPQDFATIYNTAPLLAAGINGTGTTIAIVGRSDILMSDVQSYRQLFNLPPNDPNFIHAGQDNGVNPGDDGESDLDVEISGGIAPNAKVDFVIGTPTFLVDGITNSFEYIVENNLADIISSSYGDCELNEGVGGNEFNSQAFEQAAAQGISIFIADGDNGPAECDDQNDSVEVLGYAAAAEGSTPYSVSVGGTEFTGECPTPGPACAQSNFAKYWSATTNGYYLSSALEYIPEFPWDEAKGSNANADPTADLTGLWSGSGGISAYYLRPSWQQGANSSVLVSQTDPAMYAYLAGSGGSITTENPGYWVTGVTVTNPGSGYTAATTTVTFSGGTCTTLPASGATAAISGGSVATTGGLAQITFNYGTQGGTVDVGQGLNCTVAPTVTFGAPTSGTTATGTATLGPMEIQQPLVTGVPHRLTPDLALNADDGHDPTLFCSEGVCEFTTNSSGQNAISDAGLVGGTSVAAPSMAGIQALINNYNAVNNPEPGNPTGRQGMPGYVYYGLAAAESTSTCAASALVPPNDANATTCVFQDIQAGNTYICATSTCTSSSGTKIGWASGVGYDLTTGLGSVNAYNLATQWKNVTFTSTSTTLSLSCAPCTSAIPHGTPITLSGSVSSSGSPTGDVAFIVSQGALGIPVNTTTGAFALPGDFATLSGGNFSGTISNLPAGTYNVYARYGGDGSNASSLSAPVQVTISPEPATITITPGYINGTACTLNSSSTFTYGQNIDFQVNVAGASEQGVPTGTVTITDSINGGPTNTIATETLDSNGNGYYVAGAIADTSCIYDYLSSTSPVLIGGSHSISATYSGDSTFQSPGTVTPAAVTVTPLTPAPTLAAGATLITSGFADQLTVTFPVVGALASNAPVPGLSAPTGTVTFNDTFTSTVLGTASVVPTSTYTGPGSSGFPSYAYTATAVLSTTGITTTGANTITATYSGDTNYNTATTAAATVTVGSNTATTTTLPATGATTLRGEPTFTATIAATPTAPTAGTVTFYDATYGVVLGTGTVGTAHTGTLKLGASPAFVGGAHNITATYGGNGTFGASSTSSPQVETVTKGSGAVSLSGKSVGESGSTYTFAAVFTPSVTYTAYNPVLGVMTFFDAVNGGASTAIGTAPLNIIGAEQGGYGLWTAPLVTTLSTAGTHVITASYTDVNYTSSTSNSMTVYAGNTAGTSNNIGIYFPLPGTTFPATGTTTFKWFPVDGAQYSLDIGPTQGGNTYYQSGNLGTVLTSPSFNYNVLPTNGSTVWARLWYLVNGTWQYSDASYTAYNAGAAAAVMSTPTNNSTLTGTTQTFTWSAGSAATAYWLDLGSSAGGNNYYQSGNLGSALMTTVNNLPSTGVPIYATLYSLISGSWVSNSYTYTSYNASGAAATITSPTPPNLPATTVTFDWTSSASATAYWLDVGSSVGGNQYYQSGSLPTSQTAATVSGLPSDGVSQVYVTLYSYVSGNWVSNAYTYTAFNGSSAAATMTNPASNNAVLSGTSITFTWTAGSGTTWWIDVGSTAGGNDIYQSGSINTQSATVTDLPANGNTIYVTLYTLVNNSWISNSYTYTSGP